MTTEHTVVTGSHTTFYLSDGPADGTPIVFVHGWPELSHSWRHQLPHVAALGYRAIAPDLRGYGGSSCYASHADYAQELIVADMIGLLDAVGAERAIWVGHDWGSPVVWNIASHHPDRCLGVANLCVPYRTLEYGVDACIALVDRGVYPAEQFPAGQWDYQLYYQEHFDDAVTAMERHVDRTVKALFRKGSAEAVGKPAGTASTRANGGWFGGLDGAPDLPRDTDVLTQADFETYTAALRRTGFFGANSYYMNHEANTRYALTAVNDERLDMPVLFLAARYDTVCETVDSTLAEPMRQRCPQLTEKIVDSGHWMAQERPDDVNAALSDWLADWLAEASPGAH